MSESPVSHTHLSKENCQASKEARATRPVKPLCPWVWGFRSSETPATPSVGPSGPPQNSGSYHMTWLSWNSYHLSEWHGSRFTAGVMFHQDLTHIDGFNDSIECKKIAEWQMMKYHICLAWLVKNASEVYFKMISAGIGWKMECWQISHIDPIPDLLQ